MTLSKGDLTKIGNIVDERLENLEGKIEIKLEQKLEEKLEEKLDEKLTKLRSDFYDHIDPVLKEVMASREERTIMSARLSENSDKIEALEKLHPNNSHSFASG